MTTKIEVVYEQYEMRKQITDNVTTFINGCDLSCFCTTLKKNIAVFVFICLDFIRAVSK